MTITGYDVLFREILDAIDRWYYSEKERRTKDEGHITSSLKELWDKRDMMINEFHNILTTYTTDIGKKPYEVDVSNAYEMEQFEESIWDFVYENYDCLGIFMDEDIDYFAPTL